jgi:hypothetical protein
MKVNQNLLVVLIAMVSIFSSSEARAAPEDDFLLQDGNALLAVCGGSVAASDRGERLSEMDIVATASCSSYLRGFKHGVALLSTEPEQGWGYCIDATVQVSQVARVLVKHLRDNPQVLHFHAAVLVGRALRQGFPCK